MRIEPIGKKQIAVKEVVETKRYYDEFTGEYKDLPENKLTAFLLVAVKKYDFENSKVIEEGYTSEASALVKAFNKEGNEITFVDFKSAISHPDLKYRPSTNALYYHKLDKKLRKLNWEQNLAKNFTKRIIQDDEKCSLSKEKFDLYYERGQITTSYNVSKGLQYTFGIELETCEGYVPNFIMCDLNGKSVRDGSITGMEWVSGVLKGDSGFYHTNKASYHLSRACKVDHKCGMHLHLGNIEFTKLFSVSMYMLGLRIQDEIFELFPLSRQLTRNQYYIDKGMVNGCCYKIPVLEGFEKKIYKDDRNVGDTLKKIEDLYHSLFVWMSGGNVPDFRRNKLQRHPNQYPDARYVWLNVLTANFNRTKLNFDIETTSKNKQINLEMQKSAATIEFRNHMATLSYIKIRNWILIMMACVNYAENNSYYILESDKITLAEIIYSVYGDYGNFLIKYIEERKIIYKGKSPEESAAIEDKEYKMDIKETKLFKNKLDVLCV